MPSLEDWNVHLGILNIGEESAKQYFEAIARRRAAAETATITADIPSLDWSGIDAAVGALLESLEKESGALKALQQDGKRQEMEAKLKELQGRQWLSQNKASVLAERERLALVDILDAAIKLTATHALTKKNNELAAQELAAGYQQRFADELKQLGGNRLAVVPESKHLGKGRVTFGISLVGAVAALPAGKVLSEGETRIVSLAAFLADITGSEHSAPFIFDDPISSLDQDYEEKVVGRLVDLAKTRQVIIFTHRLSLLALVEAAVKKLKDHASGHGLPAPITVGVETLRRLGAQVGLTAKLNFRDAKPAKAAARIRDEFMPQLRKHHDNGDYDAYDKDAKYLCGEFRILIERCVESVLLNEVLVRFRRDIQTKGKLISLAKIEEKDCQLLDDLMTRYSVFEHAQSDELPAQTPDLTQLDADVNSLISWIDAFGKRFVS